MSTAYAITGGIAVLGALAYVALLVWGAREDGRDQDRRDRSDT